MKVETIGHTAVIKDIQSNISGFLEVLANDYNSVVSKNIIIDLSDHSHLSSKDLNTFLELAKTHKKAKKSLVLVGKTDYNKISDKIVIVPTVQEARDMIELDEIERDLGF
ncbi:MAG TPA: ribonuclease Z [Flavobacterium sp.]|jgi:hypothetical protein